MQRRFSGAAVAVALFATALRSAAVAQTPPPTPVPPFGSPSPFPTVLETPKPSAKPPKLSAPSVALVDLPTGQVLYRKNGEDRRPIASLTKLMTALLTLQLARPSETVTVEPEAAAQTGSRLGLRGGERIRVNELLYALLLQSSNDAAVALADHLAGSPSRFIRLMNRRADRLGLEDTKFLSATGLDDRGYSTALDLAALARRTFTNDRFRTIVGTKFRRIPAPGAESRRIQNRNVLLWLYRGAIGGKSGYTSAAGYCLVAAATRGGRTFVAVVLGAPENAFNDAAALLNYGFVGFRSVQLLRTGQRLGVIRVRNRPVPVMAGADLTRLVPARAMDDIVFRLKRKRGLRLPIAAGQEVGKELVVLRGRVLGSVRAVAEQAVFEEVSLTALGPPRLRPILRLLHELGRSLLEAFL
ncbi:MAG: D-alanyl-D-alanine carboxypeptidase [Actinomycetota bacterium]|nr:D-alanyl-D-alanine carboxypeptidase [Actinomycetota bacterium]